MIDIKLIRNKLDFVKEKTDQKGYKNIDFDKIVDLDTKSLDLQQQIDDLRNQRRNLAESTKGQKPSEEQVKKGQEIKEKLNPLEELYSQTKEQLSILLKTVPNIISDDVPIGAEDSFEVVSKSGEATKTDAVDHLDYALSRDWVDFERGAKVAGNKFYYLKGDLALLENAVYQYALKVLLEKGFKYMTVPHMVNSEVATGAGFAPRTSEQSDEYFLEGEDLTLIATAEIPLTGYHEDEIIEEDQLPLKYVGYSPCYRKEAGAYGKHTRGLFRVHQFNKLEMYAFTLPEKSAEMHEFIRSTEEEIWKNIGIPYRVINIASGDLGAAAAKKIRYRILVSC